jgi:hypothetical protein
LVNIGQLLTTVLSRVLFNIIGIFFAATPSYIVRIITSHTALITKPVRAAQNHFSIALTTGFYCLYYAVSINYISDHHKLDSILHLYFCIWPISKITSLCIDGCLSESMDKNPKECSGSGDIISTSEYNSTCHGWKYWTCLTNFSSLYKLWHVNIYVNMFHFFLSTNSTNKIKLTHEMFLLIIHGTFIILYLK